MSARYLSWRDAFALFVEELALYQHHRRAGLSVAEAGATLRVSADAAQLYEDALTRLAGDWRARWEAAVDAMAAESRTAPAVTGAVPNTTSTPTAKEPNHE